MTAQPRVAVVGGGAVGVTAAHDLAANGADVTLYEKDDVGSGASGRAAGIAYDAFAEDVDAAVAARALDRFRTLDADGAVDFTECPYVWLAREGDDAHARAIRRSVERMRANGRDVELVDGDGLSDRFPALDADVAVAGLAHDAGHLDPASYVRAMVERAREAGATVRTRTPVGLDRDERGPLVETSGGRERVDRVLVAAGAHTKRRLADAGVPIPMKPYRVQALTTEPIDRRGDAAPPMTYDATEEFYLRPHEGGVLVGDGTEEREFDPDDYDATANESFVAASRERIRGVLGVDPPIERAWAGLCTATPDRDPLLGPVDGAGDVFVATGWHGHGFMRSPALGAAVADQMRGGEGIDEFDPRRFDGDEQFSVVEGMTVEE